MPVDPWRHALPIAIGALLAVPTAAAAQGACPAQAGSGTLAVTVGEGGRPATLLVTGPQGFSRRLSSSERLTVAAGSYRAELVEPRRVTEPGPLVGRAYAPGVSGSPACVRPDSTAAIRAGYGLEPGSEKLWTIDDLGAQAVGLGPDLLTASGSTAPTAALALPLTAPKGLAFDRAGNLWVGSVDGVTSFAMGSLGRSGPARPRIELRGELVESAFALAFDDAGALWVATGAGDRVLRFDPGQLGSSGRKEPTAVITGVHNPSGLAFDREGNLWVANAAGPHTVARYDRGRLGASIDGPPDVAIEAMSGPPVIDQLRGPKGIAFDREGNLWVGFYLPNVIARFTPKELAAGGTITPAVQLTASVTALVESLAFDEAGNLWYPGPSGRIARLSRAQLAGKGRLTPEVVRETEGLRYAIGIALDPAPAWSPIRDKP